MNVLRQRIKALPLQKVEELRQSIPTIAGVSQPTYDRFLNGQSRNLKVATAMADFLGCSVQQLLDDSYDLAKHYAAKPADGKAVVA